MKKNFAEEVVKTIKEKKITPKSKWNFLLKEYFVWFMGFISMVVGALSFAVIFFIVRTNDWDYYDQISGSMLKFVLMTLPYLWLLLLLAFGVLVYYYIRHTKKGYKFQALNIILIIFSSSIIFGGVLYAAGIGKAIDNVMYTKAPKYYEEIGNRRYKMWKDLERGMIAGQIITVNSNELFSIMDLNEKAWQVIADNAILAPRIEIAVGEKVRMIGEPISDLEFIAKVIGPAEHFGDRIFDRMRGNMEKHKKIMDEKFKMMMGDIGKPCSADKECKVPFDYAVRSNCPFQSACVDSHCMTFCPQAFDSWQAEATTTMCTQNFDCDCGFYAGEDKKDCICINNICGAVVGR